MQNFNPLPPCGGRRTTSPDFSFNILISIHSLRVEGDDLPKFMNASDKISIHSLRVEGDSKIAQLSA